MKRVRWIYIYIYIHMSLYIAQCLCTCKEFIGCTKVQNMPGFARIHFCLICFWIRRALFRYEVSCPAMSLLGYEVSGLGVTPAGTRCLGRLEWGVARSGYRIPGCDGVGTGSGWKFFCRRHCPHPSGSRASADFLKVIRKSRPGPIGVRVPDIEYTIKYGDFYNSGYFIKYWITYLIKC